MKAMIRVWLSISGIVIGIGLLLCIVGASLGAAGGFWNLVRNEGFSIHFNNDNDMLNNFNQSYAADQVKTLLIDMKYGEVSVVPYDGDTINVEASNPTKLFTCNLDGDTLLIEDDSSRKDIVSIGFWNDDKHPGISVYIPKQTVFAAVTMKVGAGKMEASDITTDQISIDVGAGEFIGDTIVSDKESDLSVRTGHLQLEDSSLVNLNVTCGAGKIEYAGSLKGNSQLSSGLGAVKVELSEKESDYNYRIQCDIGEVRIGDEFFSGISTKRSLDYQADNTIDIDCGVGEVDVTFDTE